MRVVERWLRRVLDEPVRAMVRSAIAEAVPAPEDALYAPLVHGDRSRLHIDPTAVVNDALFNLSSGEIRVGPYAFFGHRVAVLTGTHAIEMFDRERQLSIPRSGRDVTINRGAWLASHVLVLGPCTIGEHAVVAAGSLVIGDVAAYTVVAGRPAKPLRTIEHGAAG